MASGNFLILRRNYICGVVIKKKREREGGWRRKRGARARARARDGKSDLLLSCARTHNVACIQNAILCVCVRASLFSARRDFTAISLMRTRHFFIAPSRILRRARIVRVEPTWYPRLAGYALVSRIESDTRSLGALHFATRALELHFKSRAIAHCRNFKRTHLVAFSWVLELLLKFSDQSKGDLQRISIPEYILLEVNALSPPSALFNFL